MSESDKEMAWQRVRRCAIEHQASGAAIETLQKKVPNVIIGVNEGSIRRCSAEGTKKGSAITRQNVFDAWDSIMTGRKHPDVPYFTHALLLKAMPEHLVLRGDKLERRGQ